MLPPNIDRDLDDNDGPYVIVNRIGNSLTSRTFATYEEADAWLMEWHTVFWACGLAEVKQLCDTGL